MSSQCTVTRPAVPPKKDKIATVPTSPELLSPNSRQTTGTQVNMLRKASSPSSASRFPKDNHSANSKPTENKVITPPKPPLPPKNHLLLRNALMKGEQAPSKVVTTAATDSLISSANSVLNPKSHSSQNQTNEEQRSVQLKSTATKTDQVGHAPVASIDEFDSLSDLNSPSPKHKETFPPKSHSVPQLKAPTTPSNTKFGHFDSHVSAVNTGNAKFNKPLPPIPLSSAKSAPKNFTHNNNRNIFPSPSSTLGLPGNPPPVSPRRVTNSNPIEAKSVGVGGGSIFQFPNNHNTSSLFTAQQIQQRQGKSVSLGRGAAPNLTSITSNFKKSVTLSRSSVAPLNLITASVKAPNTIHTAPILGSQNRKPSTGPQFQIGRPVSFSSVSSSVPPPPPPRQRKSQRGLAATAGQDKSPTSPTSPSSGCDSLGIPDKPVYATVDKEKKWAARLQKQHEEDNVNSNAIQSSDSVIETTVMKNSNSDNEENSTESIVNSSLTITTRPSWLGKKFLNPTVTSETNMESRSGDGSVVSSLNQVESGSLAEAAGKSMTHQTINNNINFFESMHINTVNSTLQQQKQSHQLIYACTTNLNNKTTLHHSTETSTSSMNNEKDNNNIQQQELTTTRRAMEQEENMNDSQSLIHSQVQSEKEGLCRNESFLYAMQDTNLKEPDQLDRVQEMPYEIDNIAMEINLSSSAILDSDKSLNNAHPAAAVGVVAQLEPECEEQINQNPFWDKSFCSINNTKLNLQSNSSSYLVEQPYTKSDANDETSQNEPTMETIKVSVIPNRESVLDVFERELEIQLESLESFCAAQGVPPTSNSASVDIYEDSPQQSDTSSVMGASQVKHPDPRASYLDFVDSRLQSMQNLLQNIVTSPDIRRSCYSENNDGISHNLSATQKGQKAVGFEIPRKTTIPGMGEYMEEIETPESKNNLRRSLTDGDIVSDLLLSSKRFESSGLSSRRPPEPEVGAESTANIFKVVDSANFDIDNDGTCVDVPELKANNNNNDDNTGTDVDAISTFQRRSWNLSDYSPSQSDSSSSSSSRSRPNQRRSCDFSSVSESVTGGPPTRRKQVTSSWIDIGEDDLSTGALGDAESSDALVPSSTEDIEGHGQQGKVTTRRKRGLVNSIFGSFGKSGSSSHNCPTENRSQFFLDSPNLELESQERIGHRGNDRTRSLPASDPPRRPHRALHRISAASIGSAPLPSFSDQQIESKTNVTVIDDNGSEQNSAITTGGGGHGDKSTTMTETTVSLGESEHSSARSSVCYDEVLADLNTKQRKAFFVARELLTSERTFVDVLNLLTVDFPLALKLSSDTIRIPVIGSNDLEFILGGLPTLKGVNEVLMSELEERIAGWKENPKVADIIVKTGPFLKHYSTYVRDFERIVQRLDYCCSKYPAFAKALREFESNDRCQKLGLKHYMLKPVQRMPQYRLLLEDYLKTLDETSEDYSDTVKAIAIVKDVAEHANEAINLQINAEKLMNLQNRLPNIIVLRTNRFLLKEGELLKVCRKELQPRYFALMSDVLLCMTAYNASTGSNVKDLKLRYDLPLAGMRISSKFEDYANEFSVISTTRSFSLVAKSAREKDEWMKALSSAIQDNIKKRTCTTPDIEKEFRIGAEAPVWIQDKRVTMCQVCTAEFTVTFRRHHCRACGKCVCSNCSGNQAPLQYLDNVAARVCEACYQHLLEEFDRENREKNTDAVNEIRGRFKKVAITTSKANRQRKSIPDKFKVQAINSESRISGYLQWRERKAWKRHWFVLMDRVLYVYAASEDIVAMRTIPVLGYQIESVAEEVYAGVDPQLMFRLTHSGVSHPLVFMAENYSSVEKWITALKEATVLS